MASTIWLGTIHFENIDVPVKLHAAVSQNRVQFHQLHKKDGIRLRQQMVCRFDKTPVPAEEQVKGYQIDERKYILVDPDELERMEPESGRTIDVHEFVKGGAIDSVYIEHMYHLEPDASAKNYAVLAAALKEADAQGICTWVMRKRAYLGAITSTGSAIRLAVLRYADEILRAKSLGLDNFELSEKELQIGCELIDRLTVGFQPEKYVDEHQHKLRALIEKKIHGRKIVLSSPRHLKPTSPDKLLELLEKSLKKAA